MRLNRTSGPASEPLTLVEVRQFCELPPSDTTHDAKLNLWIAAARQKVEEQTAYVLVSQTFTLSFDTFPSASTIKIPKFPLQSVGSITYYDSDNAQQTLATTVYGVETGRPPHVYLKYNQDWPTVTEQYSGCVITFTSGFGTAANVPSFIKQTMLTQIGSWWCDRGDLPEKEWSNAYDRLWKTLMSPSYP